MWGSSNLLMNDPGQIRMFDVVWIMGIMDSGLLGIELLPQINACINTMAAIIWSLSMYVWSLLCHLLLLVQCIWPLWCKFGWWWIPVLMWLFDLVNIPIPENSVIHSDSKFIVTCLLRETLLLCFLESYYLDLRMVLLCNLLTCLNLFTITFTSDESQWHYIYFLGKIWHISTCYTVR